MIRHCVFYRFSPAVGAVERAAIHAGIAGLVGRIDGLLSCHFGPNVSPEGLGRGFDDGFVMDFVDAAARDAYLPHPAHQAAAARLVAALEGGLDGVVVFDFEVTPPKT